MITKRMHVSVPVLGLRQGLKMVIKKKLGLVVRKNSAFGEGYRFSTASAS